jgi:NAD(P)-dependent dehydrogenase (short-subunit alcohol dehydrogenase family)
MATQRKRTVLVTGASSGIGAACVERLVEEGWGVYAAVRDESEAGAARAADAATIELDVTSAGSIAAAAARVHDETGGMLHGLVNNAGIPGAGPVETMPVETFREVVETNLVGQFAVTQAFLPQLRAASGRIVFMSSLGGRVAFPYASAYHASKWGLEALAESLRAELTDLDVEVSLIEPAAMSTAIWDKGRASLAESRERMTDEQRAIHGDALSTFDERLDSQEESEDPSEVAEQVVSALTDSSPSERYLVGRGAGTLSALRGLVPDSVFDRVSQRVLGGGG